MRPVLDSFDERPLNYDILEKSQLFVLVVRISLALYRK